MASEEKNSRHSKMIHSFILPGYFSYQHFFFISKYSVCVNIGEKKSHYTRKFQVNDFGVFNNTWITVNNVFEDEFYDLKCENTLIWGFFYEHITRTQFNVISSCEVVLKQIYMKGIYLSFDHTFLFGFASAVIEGFFFLVISCPLSFFLYCKTSKHRVKWSVSASQHTHATPRITRTH